MEQERDFLMRQIKEVAKSLGQFLNVSSIKEVIDYDFSKEASLSDKEIETILLITQLKEKKAFLGYTDEEVETILQLTPEEIDRLYNLERELTSGEEEQIKDFVEN